MRRGPSLQPEAGAGGAAASAAVAVRTGDAPGLLVGSLGVALIAAALSMLALSPIGPGNDQSLFVYYAERLRGGATLYLDLWDNKQPGIFGFYAAAGALFGDGWPAARAAYALWLGAGAGVVAAIARLAAPETRAWLVAPLLTVGLTLVRNDIERPAQVESLAGLPLALLVLLLLPEVRSPALRRIRWVAAGVLVGAVGALKLVLAPVAAAVVGALLLWRIRRCAGGPSAALGPLAGVAAGLLLAWGPVIGWLLWRGAGPEFAWTMLEYPRLALAQVEPQPPARLLAALRWLAVTTALLLPAAAACAWQAWRAPRALRAGVVLGAVAWVLVGLVMIGTQRFSWWDTHMDLLVWPIGLLAALGVTAAVPFPARSGAERRASDRWARGALIAAVVLGMGVHGARFARGWASDPDWPGLRIEAAARETAARVRADAITPCGTVYAIGDPAGVERVTGLRQALPTHGLWFGAFLPAQAERLPAELSAARPDLVYFDGDEQRDFRRRWPATAAAIEDWLASDYRPIGTDAVGGRWWQRRAAGTPDDAPCPPPGRFTIPAGGA